MQPCTIDIGEEALTKTARRRGIVFPKVSISSRAIEHAKFPQALLRARLALPYILPQQHQPLIHTPQLVYQLRLPLVHERALCRACGEHVHTAPIG